jgi:D-glycero-alpha-D-manno-heptose-7-phosphate kinase
MIAATVTRDRAHRAPSVQPLYRAKAPLRVSFAGGGTDVAPFPEREGGLVLSATINRYAHGVLRPRTDGIIRVSSLDLGTALEYGATDPVSYDGQLDLVKAAISRLAALDEARGIELSLHTAAPPGSGLGASSALIVSLIGLLRDYHRLALTDYDVAELAWEVERLDVGLKGGLQDQYAASFGGFNFL